MCMQCVVGATGAVGAVTTGAGLRVWLAAASPAWLTRGRLKVISAFLVVAAVIGAGIAPG